MLVWSSVAAGGGEDRDDSWLPPDVEPFVLRGGITSAMQVRGGMGEGMGWVRG